MKIKLIMLILLLNAPKTKGESIPELYVENVKIASITKPDVFTPEFLLRQRMVESGNRQLERSKAGAIGVAQFMPSTWMWLKAKGVIHKKSDIHNAMHQIIAQKSYMEYLYHRPWNEKYDRVRSTVASYNCGRGRVLRTQRLFGTNWENHLPKETKNYLRKLFGK